MRFQLRILTWILVGFCVAALPVFCKERLADLLLLNGRIYTSNPARPWAEALAIRGEKILAVGTDREVGAFRGPRTEVINLGGRMAMPGIIDSHIHFLGGSLALEQIGLDDASSVAEIQRRVKTYAAANPQRAWLVGRGWFYNLFQPSGLPSKQILDEVVRNRPVVLKCYDGHSVWVNSRALELAGITRDTPDPKRGDLTVGTIVRDAATGEPTGVLKEAAGHLIERLIPAPTREEKLRALGAGLKEANRHGLTSAFNATGSVDDLELYDELRRAGPVPYGTGAGALTVRMKTALGLEPKLTPQILRMYEDARRRFIDAWVRAGAIKAFADGVIESHTAAMLEPYADDPKLMGSLNYTPEQFRELVAELDRGKFQVITHAIGDRAVRVTLDAYEAAARANGPRDRRFRIEHIESAQPQDVRRFGALGVIASMQPYHCYPEPNLITVWARNVGQTRLENSFPWHDLAAGGARLNFGSDWPVVSLDPFIGIQNAVTRQQDNGEPPGGWVGAQRVTLDQALAAYTRDAAYGEFEDDLKGTLEPGKLADVIVLSQDLFRVRPLEIHKTKVLLTLVGGKIVHREGM